MMETRTASTVRVTDVDLRAHPSRARYRARIVATTLAYGLAGGVVFGAAYRGWMRLIATDPSFTWEGTIGIIVFMAIGTLSAAVAVAVRQHVQRRWLRGLVRSVTAALVLLVLSSPPATATAPAFVAGALAWGHPGWPRRRRRALAVVAAMLTAISLLLLVDLAALPLWRAITASGGYVLLIALSSWLLAIPAGTRPVREGAVQPGSP